MAADILFHAEVHAIDAFDRVFLLDGEIFRGYYVAEKLVLEFSQLNFQPIRLIVTHLGDQR